MGKGKKTYLNHPDIFPNSLRDRIEITSPEDSNYNCLAWALGDTANWWEPGGFHWPHGQSDEMTLKNVVKMLAENFNFIISSNHAPEMGFEKIALFSCDKKFCDHVALLLPNGNWTSKLGVSFDIIHTLNAISGGIYGHPEIFLKRKNLEEK